MDMGRRRQQGSGRLLLLAVLVRVHAEALSSSRSRFASFSAYLREQQSSIIGEVEALEGGGASFCVDEWSREDGSSGVTRVIEGGAVVEKGCVSTSFIKGTLTPQRASAMSARGRSGIDAKGGQHFEAAALSLVLHARSPMVPTLRGDARCFVVFDDDGEPLASWYGGGCDLTPSYLFDEDAEAFHGFWRRATEVHRPGLYEALKAACDEYFYLPLRREHRGVGGIFWDDDDADYADALARDVLAGMIASWRPIVEKRKDAPFTDDQKNWQLLRRGRYLEFNLLNDRGVKFGLSPDAIERIMVSAPPLIAWRYKADPVPGSDEARLLEVLTTPRKWA